MGSSTSLEESCRQEQQGGRAAAVNVCEAQGGFMAISLIFTPELVQCAWACLDMIGQGGWREQPWVAGRVTLGTQRDAA